MNPRNFLAELKRRNVYKVAVAYAVVAWLLIQAASIVFPTFEAPAWIMKVLMAALLIGFPLTIALSWAFEITPEGIKRESEVEPNESITAHTGRKLVGITFVLAVIAAGLLLFQQVGTHLRGVRDVSAHDKDGRPGGASPPAALPAIPDKSIAVLPFVDMSQAKDQEYFCDGISEEILDALAKVETLRVVSRTSSFSFKGKNADVSEVASKLNVANVLEGSLRRAGNRIRVTAQLINARSGFHLWSETYERELQDVFTMQDEITRSIVDALKIKLAVAPSAPASHNTAAHDLYLQGLFFSNKSDEANLRKALDFFQRAIEKDPTSSRAWTGLARVWDFLADAYMKPLDAYPHTKEAAAKAIALDERNAEAHAWLGDAMHVLDWDLAGDERELKRALEIDPNLAIAHIFSGMLHWYRDEGPGAVSELEEGMKLDPLSTDVAALAVLPYLRTGHVDKATAAAQRISDLDPNYIYRDPPFATIYLETGRDQEALDAYAKAQEMTHTPYAGHAIAYAHLGRPEEAHRVLNQMLTQAGQGYVPGTSIASVYAALGEKEEAFRWLERAFAEHDVGMFTIKIEPTFRALQSDPRFADLLRRVGLDPAPAPTTPSQK